MPDIRIPDIDRGASLLKQIVKKADINGDDAIRTGDLNAIRQHAHLQPATSPRWNDGSAGAHVLSGILAAVGRAKSRGGPELTKVNAAIDEFKRNAHTANADHNTILDVTEQRRMSTAGEKNFLSFVVWAKGKTIRDIDLPAQHVGGRTRPKFDPTGTPAHAAQSLLAAFNKTANDNFWPRWATGQPGPSRIVIAAEEARAMIAALKKLSPTRQKAILRALASRTKHSEFGCVSPQDAAKTALEAHATRLGLRITFGQPAAPAMPTS